MKHKYEIIIAENEAQMDSNNSFKNFFYLFLFCLSICLIFSLIFFYNYAISLKIAPTLIHQQKYEENEAIFGHFNDNLIRNLENGLIELYYSTTKFENKNIREQMIRLMAISRKLSMGNEEWHKNALAKLGEQIQQKLKKLQNPQNCRQARLLIQKWDKDICGLGCIMHYVGFGLVIAAASNRVLMFENDATQLWGDHGWNGIFEPITKCKYSESVNSTSFPEYLNPGQSERIVWMPSRWGYTTKIHELEHIPLVVPNEFFDFLQKHHSNPPAWFLGQFIYFLWKPKLSILEYINSTKSAIGFEKDGQPIVGLHVRRTDKNTEARYHELADYIKWLKLWFDVNEMVEKKSNLTKRRLFIATDEPTVILDARQKFGTKNGTEKFEIYAFEKDAKLAEKYANRFSTNAIEGMIAEIEMLIRCNFVVCTFSSNICRLVYELMQALHGNAAGRVKSLDIFYEEWFDDHRMEAIGDYSTPEMGEIGAKKGEILVVSQLFWNGSVIAKHLNSEKKGLFPSFLLKDHLKNASFPIFSEFNLNF